MSHTDFDFDFNHMAGLGDAGAVVEQVKQQADVIDELDKTEHVTVEPNRDPGTDVEQQELYVTRCSVVSSHFENKYTIPFPNKEAAASYVVAMRNAGYEVTMRQIITVEQAQKLFNAVLDEMGVEVLEA